MIKNITYIIAVLGAGLFLACEENERLAYDAGARVYFYEQVVSGAVTEEVYEANYSFADKSSELQQDTLFVTTQVMGTAATVDRSFKATVVGDSSMHQQVDGVTYYTVLDGVIKAGEIQGYLPLVLYRTALIKDSTLQVTLQITEDESYDLQPGVPDYTVFTVYWADRLIEPDNWETELYYFFGTYSDTKYQFMIDILGISEYTIYSRFNPEGQYTSAQIYDFVNHLKEALADYNAANDPDLTDENGELVTFP